MKFYRHDRFKKAYKKRVASNSALVKQVDERLRLFDEDPQNPLLKDHALKSSFKEFRAFSVTGDIRIIYKKEKDTVILYDIGSHNQVYR